MAVEKLSKNVSFAVDEESESEIEIDSDGEDDVLEMSESESESGDEDESESEDVSEDDGYELKFGLKEKEMRGLWKWCNPNKKYPNGLLTERSYTGKYYRKNWKEIRSKDWLKEWKKKERISGKDKYWIRGGKLVNASSRWRERASRKKLKQ